MDKTTWALEAYDKILHKMHTVVERNKDAVPYTAGEDGRYRDASYMGWWTNGFYGGICWQLYSVTHDELYKEVAEKLEGKLDSVLMNSDWMDHDSGFRWLPTSFADYKLTKNVGSRNRLLLAADNFCGRFNPVGKFVKAWNSDGNENRSGIAIIDCMMNLPLLYWAAAETGDPKYRHIAKLHAITAMRYFIREDGSACHIVRFDPESGGFIESVGGQGYAHGSSWTRGQAWALYGFTLSFIHTGDERFLQTALKSADYFISQIPENGLIPVDFRQPDSPWIEDSSAAAIAASGLLLLSDVLRDRNEDSQKYQEAAEKLLRALTEKRCDFSYDKDYIVEKCTAAYHDKDHEFPIIYGDYYYIEGMMRLLHKDLFIWGK